MARHGRGQPNAIDRLDAVTRDKCISLLLSGKKGCSAEVATIAGVSRQAITDYRQRHLNKALEIAGRLTQIDDKLIKATQQVVAALPVLTVRDNRIKAQQDRWDRMQTVMAERAADMQDIPGGKSGLLVRSIKQIGNGESAREVEEYKLDAALLAEFREHERFIAIECGEWQEGSSTAGGNVVVIQVASASSPTVESPGAPTSGPLVIDLPPAKG